MREFIEELKYNKNINFEKDFENRIDIDYVIERLEDIQKEQNNNFEISKIYDNGTMIIGELNKVINYIARNDKEEQYNDLIEDLEDLKQYNGVIVCINYDLGMGYSIEWWENSHIVNNEEKEDNMNKEELVEKMYNYYKRGINNVNSLIDLKNDIKNNLESIEGVQSELDSCVIELSVVEMNEERFVLLNEIWNDLNKLKTEYERQGV